MLKIGDMREGTASAQPPARAVSAIDAPVFGRALLDMLGGGAVDAQAAAAAIELKPEPEPQPEPERDPDDEDADVRLMTLLPGIELLARRTDNLAAGPAPATGHTPNADQGAAQSTTLAVNAFMRAEVPAPLPVDPVVPTTIPADAVGTAQPKAETLGAAAESAHNKPAPVAANLHAATTEPGVSATATPATGAPGWPGAILELAASERERSRMASARQELPSAGNRNASMQSRDADTPASSELQTRRQLAAQTATAPSTSRIAAAPAQDANRPAPASPQGASPTASTPVAVELATRIAGDKADARAPSQPSSATPGVNAAPGFGTTGVAADPALRATTANPDFTGAEGRAAWQQALARHVGLIVAGESTEARLQVESGKLGPIEVHVKIDGERVDVRFSIQHPITASLVHDAMPRLEKMLEQQGFSLGHSSINQGQSGQQGERNASETSRSFERGGAGDGDRAGNEPAPLQGTRSRAENALLDDFA